MARSRSRSPRWTHRSPSPELKDSEYYKQRYPHGQYDDEYRKEPKRSVAWRVDDDKYGQSKSRNLHGSLPYRQYDCKSPSPSGRRDSGENVYGYKSYDSYSPVRGDSSRRFQYMPKYVEGPSYKEYQRDSYVHYMPEKYIPSYYRMRGNGKGRKSPPRALVSPPRFDRNWYDEEVRYPRIQDEKYTQSFRRDFDDFDKRSTYQKRYSQEHDFRKYEYMLGRPKYVERYESREPARFPHWKSGHSPHREKRVQWNLGPHVHRYSQWEPLESSSAIKTSSDSHYKRHRISEGDEDSLDERTHKYFKVDDRKYTSPKSSPNRESSRFSPGRGRKTESERPKEPGKAPKKDGPSYSSPDRSDNGVKFSYDRKELGAREEGNVRESGSSSNPQLEERSVSDEKPSSAHLRKKALNFKVDKKKAFETSRQSEDSDPDDKHLDSTENTENKSSGEFAKEIITLIHQVKANYFPSPGISLNERFSKKTAKQDAKEANVSSDPEIHRRIDMSFTDLQSKQTNKQTVLYEPKEELPLALHSEVIPGGAQGTLWDAGNPTQTVAKIMDANDLRHDIERRRKKRFQVEDTHIFRKTSTAERDDQPSTYSMLDTQDDTEAHTSARYIKQSFRKFIQNTEMNVAAEENDSDDDDKSLEDEEEDEEKLDTKKRRKTNCRCGRFLSFYKSNLVQKSLCIQAKYQRLRVAGARGFLINKFRDRLLRIKKESKNNASGK